MKWLIIAVLSLVSLASSVQAQNLVSEPTWQAPDTAQVRKMVLDWSAEARLNQVAKLKVQALWPESTELSSNQLLVRVCETAAVIDARATNLVTFCVGPPENYLLKPQPVLNEAKLPVWMRNNLSLLYGRWLARNRYYDEALVHLEGLEPADVVDPASLLFFQAAGFHRMLQKNECLKRVVQLMERESELPRRYRMLAKLMEADLKPLKADSLDEISRLMDEIERRLDLYQAGKVVRRQEDEVIAKLDKLIEEIEQQQQQQQQSSGGGSSRSSSPAQDSMPLGGHGPGLVDKKFIGNKSGWGNLPPKEREAALQQITKDLPAHYREVIESYFRKLANSGN